MEKGDLLKEIEKEKKLEQSVQAEILSLISKRNCLTRLNKFTVRMLERSYRPMIDFKKYNMTKDDMQALMFKPLTKWTIGAMALEELENMDGAIEMGSEIEKRLLQKMEYEPATLIWHNADYANRVIAGVHQFDCVSAYPYWVLTQKMPVRIKKTYHSLEIIKSMQSFTKDHVYVLETDTYARFINIYEPIEVTEIKDAYLHEFETEMIGSTFFKKWLKIKKENDRARKFAKDMLNVSIGAIHKYRKNIIARYVWYLQKTKLTEIRDYLERSGCIPLKCHTDSIAYVGMPVFMYDYIKEPEIGCGHYKNELYNRRLYMINAGQYQYEHMMPKLSGFSWGGRNIILEDGKRIDVRNFPCIQKGMMIKSFEKDGIIVKELGATIDKQGAFKKWQEFVE